MKFFARFFGAALVSLALVGTAYADEPDGADAARTVIQSQLDAFGEESVTSAYQFAAPNVQRIFPSPEIFGRMVRNGYPMVWNPSETDFLDAIPRGDMIVQRLRIIDQAGIPYIAEYMMVQIDGEWRIAGVEINKDDSYGV